MRCLSFLNSSIAIRPAALSANGQANAPKLQSTCFYVSECLLAKELGRASEHGSVRQLSFLVEILGTKPLPGSIELISYLLQVLSNIVQNLSPSEAEVNYTEQLLMSAVESAASRVSVSSFIARLPFWLIIDGMAGCSQPVADGYSCRCSG